MSIDHPLMRKDEQEKYEALFDGDLLARVSNKKASRKLTEEQFDAMFGRHTIPASYFVGRVADDCATDSGAGVVFADKTDEQKGDVA